VLKRKKQLLKGKRALNGSESEPFLHIDNNSLVKEIRLEQLMKQQKLERGKNYAEEARQFIHVRAESRLKPI
jgi:hypothetical protein